MNFDFERASRAWWDLSIVSAATSRCSITLTRASFCIARHPPGDPEIANCKLRQGRVMEVPSLYRLFQKALNLLMSITRTESELDEFRGNETKRFTVLDQSAQDARAIRNVLHKHADVHENEFRSRRTTRRNSERERMCNHVWVIICTKHLEYHKSVRTDC